MHHKILDFIIQLLFAFPPLLDKLNLLLLVLLSLVWIENYCLNLCLKNKLIMNAFEKMCKL